MSVNIVNSKKAETVSNLVAFYGTLPCAGRKSWIFGGEMEDLYYDEVLFFYSNLVHMCFVASDVFKF